MLEQELKTEKIGGEKKYKFEMDKAKKNPVKKKKEYNGILYLYSSFNNTIAHVTDMSGETIARYSGGMVTKQDRLKANPTTGMFIAKKLGEELKDMNVKSLYVKMRGKTLSTGVGPGAHMVVKTLSKDGFKIISINEVSRIPRGGPKKKGGRRGRRV